MGERQLPRGLPSAQFWKIDAHVSKRASDDSLELARLHDACNEHAPHHRVVVQGRAPCDGRSYHAVATGQPAARCKSDRIPFVGLARPQRDIIVYVTFLAELV